MPSVSEASHQINPMFRFNHHLLIVSIWGKRYVIHQGGTRSGKTYFILQLILYYMSTHPGARITIVGQTLPHLRRGVLPDLRDIIHSLNWDMHFSENKT